MNQEVRDAQTRMVNSRELAERAKRIYDKDLSDLLSAIDRLKRSPTSGGAEHE